MVVPLTNPPMHMRPVESQTTSPFIPIKFELVEFAEEVEEGAVDVAELV